MDGEGDANTSALPSASGHGPATDLPEEAEEDFNAFADDYLLAGTDLTGDLPDVTGALGEPSAKLPHSCAGSVDHSKQQDGLLQFGWDNAEPALRSAPQPAWHGENGNGAEDGVRAEKARQEPGDSSEWEQTHSSLPMVTQSESPESVLRGGKARSQEDGRQGRGHLQVPIGPFSNAHPFQQRSQAAMPKMRNSVSQSHLGSRFGPEFAIPEQERLDHGLGTPSAWAERRASAPLEAVFNNSPLEAEWRHVGQRQGMWPDVSGEAAVSMDGGLSARAAVSHEPSMYRMRSDMTGQPFRERYPRRQFSAELAFEHSRDYGAGRMDPGYDGLTHYPSMPMSDGYGRPVRMNGGGGVLGSSYYSPRLPLLPDNGLEGSRKRAREAYLQASDVQAQQQQERHGLRASPRSQPRMKQRATHEEQLISSLKRQILALDPTTKAVLKESLYRISRNTNARAAGMGEAQQHRMPTRNSFVDRVVANLMYNRFQSPPVRGGLMRHSSGGGWPADAYGSGGGGSGGGSLGNGGSRMGGSPHGMGMARAMHLDESPNA